MSGTCGKHLRVLLVLGSLLAIFATPCTGQEWTYRYDSGTDFGFWSWGSTDRFRYDYYVGQWWDTSSYGGWQELGSAGFSAVTRESGGADPNFVGNGSWHTLGTGLSYLYLQSGDSSRWKINGNYRFAYSYTWGVWYDYFAGSNTWSLMGSGLSSDFLGDGDWHTLGTGLSYLYLQSGDSDRWKINGNYRFAYLYGWGMWYDYFAGTNTWSLMGSGLSSDFLGDGDWHALGTGLSYMYVQGGDSSRWKVNGNWRFAYWYGPGQWLDYRLTQWTTLGKAGQSSAYIGDGAYHALWGSGDTAKYEYIAASNLGYWSSTGTANDNDFRYNYGAGQWYRYYDGSTAFEGVTYYSNRKYVLEDYIYWTSAGLKSTTPTGSAYGADVQYFVWSDSTNSNLASWYIFTPGSDLKWSGGSLQVAVIDSSIQDNGERWMRMSEQFTNEDVLVLEYEFQNNGSGATLSQILTGLGYVTGFYGKTIDDLAVMGHGNTSGFFFGQWISTSNYSSYASSWAQLNTLMADGGHWTLYHCDTGSAAGMLNSLASLTNTKVFANINLGWNTWWGKINNSYAYGADNVWNANYLNWTIGRVAREAGETYYKYTPDFDFIDLDFEYQSDTSLGTRGYHSLFTPYMPDGWVQADMIWWWNNGYGRP